MIKVRYFAADIDFEENPEELKIILSNSADSENFEKPISDVTLNDVLEDIKIDKPIENYVNFFKNGLDLYDETVVFGGYVGYINPFDAREENDNIISISWIGSNKPLLNNGLTVVFNKYTCKGIKVYAVYEDGTSINIGELYEENGLPEKTYVDFKIDTNNLSKLDVQLYDFFIDTPINIKGIVLGKIIEIEDISSFDMLTEVNPISDDLSINETNINAIIKEDFNDDYGQRVLIFDNDKIFQNNVVNKIQESQETENLYEMKIRGKVELLDRFVYSYPYNFVGTITEYGTEYNFEVTDWSKAKVSFIELINKINKNGYNINILYPKDLDSEKINKQLISPILEPCSMRKIIQQIAWAMCYMVDTVETKNINLVPFFSVSEENEPDIVINNNNDRILKSSVEKGEVYSKIIWTQTKYNKKNEEEQLGVIIRKSDTNEKPCYTAKADFTLDEPFNISEIGLMHGDTTINYSPFDFNLKEVFEQEISSETAYRSPVYGYKYSKYDDKKTILTGNTNGATLEINKQVLFPLDEAAEQRKIEQLKKWYKNNNTLTATIVDNEGEIKVGKIIKIQLKNEKYFQGIVTKVTRTNISDYHTIDLEAHEWN